LGFPNLRSWVLSPVQATRAILRSSDGNFAPNWALGWRDAHTVFVLMLATPILGPVLTERFTAKARSEKATKATVR
jgi:hypothetical protein